MYSHACDRCGRPLGKDETRYIVEIKVYADAGPIEIDEEDLAKDSGEQADEAAKRADAQSEEELMNDVFAERKYDLCRPCKNDYLNNPLPERE